ncbi:MAG: metal ABC transporter solute-binding protein, Zn/Mn family [Candidatus Poseidoniaceae archaeon]
MTTHEDHDEYTTEEDCENAGYMWMEEEHEDMDADEMIEMFDTDSDGLLSLNEFLTMAEEMGGDEHDDDHGHSDDDSGNASDDGHDEHDPAHEIEMAMFEIMFHMADMNEDENLSGDELDRLMGAMEEDLPISGEEMAEIYFDIFDEDENDLLTLDEFSEMTYIMMEEEEDHGEGEGPDQEWLDNMSEMMFTMYDADQDGNISMEEFSEVMEMMGDEHEEGVAFIGFHVEEEGDYGFALPAGVELHILSMGGHEGHDHGSHGEGEMVCYDMSTHTVDTTHTTEEDCEGAGLMWTENQRPDVEDEGTHDEEDHRDEDGHDDHDDHGDEEALAYDPHSWLDPLAYKAQVALVLGEMKTAFPDLADTFQTNADAFMASLDEVDADYNAAFGPNGTCTNNTVAANHNAYSYMAYRYNLEFVTVHGLDPEGEPSAADIAEVVEKIEEDAITVLFIEEYTDETAVNSIVDQTNGAVTVQTLYTMELAPKDSSDDYLSLMEKNLNSLKAGLGC